MQALPVFLEEFPLPPPLTLWRASVLPTDARSCVAALRCLMMEALPGGQVGQQDADPTRFVCLHLGVHTAATKVHLERCAYNEATFRCPDEAWTLHLGCWLCIRFPV